VARIGGKALNAAEGLQVRPDYFGDGSYDWAGTLEHW
jgi:hypothetical protein